ncbi:MAG: hypothetical protein IJV43_02125 [Oscillospiraceae bacterium]|nr:hypothetical protein [Oscillospiraceae bacterium]
MAVENGASQSFEAETAVIGSMLIDPDVIPRVLAAVDPRDIQSTPCRLAFQAAQSLFREGKSVDAFNIRNVIGKKYAGFLAECMEVTPTSANVFEYIDVMHEQATLERIRAQAMTLTTAATLDECREAVKALGEEFGAGRKIESWTLAELLADFATRQADQTPKEYIGYGLAPVDEGTYTERGDIVMIGGSPSDGKTAFALITAYHMAQKYNVGFFSLETNKEKLEDRLVASGFQIDLAAIKKNSLSDEDWSRFEKGLPDASRRRLRIFRASGITADEIIWTSRAYGLDVVFIDYVQLITPEVTRGVSRADQMAEVSRTLKTFALTSNTAVVELAQLTRQERGSKRERDMFDLGESSQFEKDADIILLLYRPGSDTHFIEGDKHSETLDPDKTRILRVAKNKEGRWGRWPLSFDGAHQSFSILAENSFNAVQRAVREEKHKRSGIQGQQSFETLGQADEKGMPF